MTTHETPFKFGVANIIRYRGAKPRFLEAFETVLSTDYQGEGEEVSIVACGPMVPEAMRAAWLLKEECGIETRIVNVHTVKPLDVAALVRAADETGLVVTAEEHQVGGFGNIVAGAILQNRQNFQLPLLLDRVGVPDCFGVSGKPWELMQWFGLSAEHIADARPETPSQTRHRPTFGGVRVHRLSGGQRRWPAPNAVRPYIAGNILAREHVLTRSFVPPHLGGRKAHGNGRRKIQERQPDWRC